MDLANILGVIGVALLLLAYFLSLVKVLNNQSPYYFLLNIAGAATVGYSSYMIEFWPFVVLEAVWVVVSIVPLVKLLTKGPAPTA